jgi:Tol biopolymer transport system component
MPGSRVRVPPLLLSEASHSPRGAGFCSSKFSDSSAALAISVATRDGHFSRSLPVAIRDGASWSPDGRQIGFVAGRAFVMNADGTGLKALTRSDWLVTAFFWSSDGRKVTVLQVERAVSQDVMDDVIVENIWVMDSDGADLTNLTNFVLASGADHHVDGLAWSPGTQTLAYATGGEIYTISADGTNKPPLTGTTDLPAKYPIWSPDGRTILFLSGSPSAYDIMVMNYDGSDMRNLTNSPADRAPASLQP